jgi:endoglucanase
MRRLLLLSLSLGLAACGGKAITGAGEDGDGGSGGYGAGGLATGGWASGGTGGFGTGATTGAGGLASTGGVFGVGGGVAGAGGGTPMNPPCSERALPGTPCRLAWAGVNLASAEFGSAIPGIYDKDYTYPGPNDVGYFAKKGMTIIRLPFRWERLQPVPGGPFDSEELARLKKTVTLATAQGMTVILDPHNYARFQLANEEHIIGDGTLTPEHFADLWSQLSIEFRSELLVVFGLMNEPHDIDAELWAYAANLAIDAIRSTGATQLILVPGTNWTGAHSWTKTQNALAMLDVFDPLDNFAYEAHQYLDSNYSGGSESCTVTDASTVLEGFTNWLRANGKRGFLGEFGAGSSDACKTAVTSVLDHLETNADVWMGWTYWAGGPWWGDYFTSISPTATGADKPQMTWLVPHLP